MAPRALASLIGVSEHRMLLRLFGLREMVSGVGPHAAPTRSVAVGACWGDALDLACLGAALMSDEARPGRIAAAMAAVAGVTALDVLCSQQLSQSAPQQQGQRADSVSRSIGRLQTCTGSGVTSRISRASCSPQLRAREHSAAFALGGTRPRRHNRRVGCRDH